MEYNLYYYDSVLNAVVMKDKDNNELIIECAKANALVVFDDPEDEGYGVERHGRHGQVRAEVAGQDRRRARKAPRPFGHAAEEVELLPEFGIELAIGNVAARRDIDIIEPDPRRQSHPDVARLAVRLPVIFAHVGQLHLADDRDAMVHTLAMGDDVNVAQRPEHLRGEGAAFDLGFLQAQNVGGFFAQEFFDDADAGADAVDIPRSDAGASHAVALSAPRIVRNAIAAPARSPTSLSFQDTL